MLREAHTAGNFATTCTWLTPLHPLSMRFSARTFAASLSSPSLLLLFLALSTSFPSATCTLSFFQHGSAFCCVSSTCGSIPESTLQFARSIRVHCSSLSSVSTLAMSAKRTSQSVANAHVRLRCTSTCGAKDAAALASSSATQHESSGPARRVIARFLNAGVMSGSCTQ